MSVLTLVVDSFGCHFSDNFQPRGQEKVSHKTNLDPAKFGNILTDVDRFI